MSNFERSNEVIYKGNKYFIINLYGEPNDDQPAEQSQFAYINPEVNGTILASDTLKVLLNDLHLVDE